MELGLREWLIIGGVIVVLLIVLDGWRRMRGGGNRLRMKIDKSLSDLPDQPEESSFNPELPGGGARVVGTHGYGNTDSRREPVFGNEAAVASTDPDVDGLDLSSGRTVESAEQETELNKTVTSNVSNNTASAPSTEQQATVDKSVTPKVAVAASTITKEPLKSMLDDQAAHNRSIYAADQDPLFAAADSFPPHHDGPSFDERDEAIAAREERLHASSSMDMTTENVAAITTDLNMTVEADKTAQRDSDQPITLETDELIISTAVESESESEPEPEPELRAKTVEIDYKTAIDSLFPAGSKPIFAADSDRVTLTYAAEEDDDLIDALPDNFRPDAVAEAVLDEDESEFDYTRPVSELMCPQRQDNNQLQQASMDLQAPQHQPVDEVAASQSNADICNSRTNINPESRYQPSEPELEHFSALDDVEEPELTASLFTDEQPVAVTPEQDVQFDQSTEQVKDSAAYDSNDGSEVGIKGQSLQKIPEADKVLVISVVALEGEQSFSGRSLLQILLACGMRYGDMKIFHRYEDGIDQGAIQFSMTNALEPGYFDIDTMDSVETRGVTFFMSMEEPRDIMNAYECMLATASAVAKNLHGVLLDENRSTMRDQTKEHYRERIRKFEMLKLKKTTTA